MATRTVNSVRNVAWADFAQTAVDMEVDFDEQDEEFVAFTASPDDPESYGVDLYNRAIAGDFGPIADWPRPDNVTGERAMELLREDRDRLLVESDYIEMPTKWATLSADQQTAWASYRNALRDIPADYPNAELQHNGTYTDMVWVNVTWPVKPE